jgi:hypothetical protein
MAPIISRDSKLTRLSVGWLEDIGYQVTYDQVETFVLAPNCKCNKRNRRFVRHLGPMELNGALHSNATSAPTRKLSLEGYNAAMAAGLSHLNDMHKRHKETASSARASETGGIQFVGDKVVSVMYMEEGTMYCIIVRRE